jgi:glutamate-ammonia-ligase adenylyltransferase
VDNTSDTYDVQRIAHLLGPIAAPQEYPHLTADLALLLDGMASHTVPPVTVQALAQAVLASVDPQRALNHLLRYLHHLAVPQTFWTAVQQQPHALASVVTIFAGSQFLSSILWRRPQLLFWLLDGALGAAPPAPQVLAEEFARLLHGKDTEAEVAAGIRAFTLQHLVRIGARDLNDLADVEETTADLSALADCVIQTSLHVCQGWLEATHGQPWYIDEAGQQHPCHFCVIGMGKLGGYELNFSSDIDLMYVYTSYKGQTTGVRCEGIVQNQISNHEYFVALARRLTNVLGGKGPEGQAFRVDLRLRPDGTQGQLALSLLSYEAYYARLGQTWEKMALLKARPVAGDKGLGDEFMTLVHPFIYQRHLDPEGLRQLQVIKQQIDTQLADKDQAHTNVKLGLGGIREIEFFIQILQLLFGGRSPALQERHSLRALTKLRAAGFITLQIEATLRQTYCYLRRLEHYLQMEQGAQTHTLPQSDAQRLRLAHHFGYTTWEVFYQDYLARTEAVHAIFTTAFQATPAALYARSSATESIGEEAWNTTPQL